MSNNLSMEIETVQHYNYDDFIESNLELSEREVQLIGEEDPISFRKEHQTFTYAGIATLIAGVGVFIATNAGFVFEDFLPFLIAGGLAGLGIGLWKGFRKIFGKRRLNLPSLKVRRKTEQRSAPEVRAVPQQSNPFVSRHRRRGLAKSPTDSVLMGVCGGLAANSGISSAIIRLLFIAAFAITGGSAAVIYFLLGAFLPMGEKPKPRYTRRKNSPHDVRIQ